MPPLWPTALGAECLCCIMARSGDAPRWADWGPSTETGRQYDVLRDLGAPGTAARGL